MTEEIKGSLYRLNADGTKRLLGPCKITFPPLFEERVMSTYGGKLTIIKTDGTRSEEVIESAHCLEKLQAAVGGSIEVVPRWETFEGKPCVAFCNEEGKLDDLPVNGVATTYWYKSISFDPGDVLVGDVAIVTGTPEFMRNI